MNTEYRFTQHTGNVHLMTHHFLKNFVTRNKTTLKILKIKIIIVLLNKQNKLLLNKQTKQENSFLATEMRKH